MPSSYTSSLRLEMQAAGENLNTWGAPKLNNVIARVDAAIAGVTTLALGAATTYTLASSNGDDQARAAILDIVSGSDRCTITIPAVSKTYLVRNRTTKTMTITSGGSSTVPVDAGAIVQVFSDGVDVKELGFAGLGLKSYIDAAVLGATGTLPAAVGNNGKGLFVTAGAWGPRFATAADISDFNSAVDSRAIALALAL